ncbi:hypothetical protein [Larkinella rosea]|uniref:Uncharacterized protein n=1 Tax=Larkinella rosea TaxID=2025312 RepID=A0A3P1BZX1_9BACT|nr:hypothetical protein [Larkinella rosea]RRB06333.1 hypothetical protein EHT25_00565 [Larkinella rosea]
MWLYFNVRYPHGKRRSFHLYSEEIEQLMEAVNYVVSSGSRLLSVYLIDEEGRRTDLPVIAFDGAPMQDWMRKLETEYDLVLTSPLV